MGIKPLTPTEKTRIRRLIDERGVVAAARALDITVSSLLRVTGGVGTLRKGTLMVLRAALAALDEQKTAA